MPINLRFQSARRSTGPPCPRGREESYLTMGCTASKPTPDHTAVNDWYTPVAKGISMPTHAWGHMQVVDDFEIVPLAGRRYGIMKVEAHNEEPKDLIHGDFMREALKRLDQLDVVKDSTPKSWLESTSMLEDLKPGLEKYFSDVGGLQEVVKPGSGSSPSSRIQSERYAVTDDFFGDSVAERKGGNRTVSKEEGRAQSHRREQNGRLNCDSYISAISNDRSKKPKSFRSAKSLMKLFSFGGQTKRGSKTARNGLLDVEGAPCRKDALDDSLNSSSEPRSSLFDPDFLASFEDVMKKISEDKLDPLQTSAAGADSCVNIDTPKKQMPNAQANVKDGLDSEAQKQAQHGQPKVKNGRVSDAQRPRPKPDSLTAAPKRAPAMKKPVIKKPDPLEKFGKVFLPGCEKTVVLYTTSLRGVRKTFEDCSNVRAVLQSFGISIDERDISMHQEFRNELRTMLSKPVPVPQLFIKCRYIGGVEEVLRLHEDGQLGELLEGIAKDEANGRVCDGCGGVRFVPCLDCRGSRKLVNEEEELVRCPHCNENGLIQCPLCSY